MCGIAGFINLRRNEGPEELALAGRRMAAAVRHRGPDDEGLWVDAKEGVVLVHRRLAILDLSEEGHQPMRSADGRYVLVFNGEIYNFRLLRSELESVGCVFRGHSDTEIMLAAFCEWGFEESLRRLVGMFALALWDRRELTLHLARDRMGEKPLYYGWSGGVFLFGSELKSLRAHPCWRGEIDHSVLADFVPLSFIPGPKSIYRNVRKLLPGHFLSLVSSRMVTGEIPEPRAYWSPRLIAERAMAHPFGGTDDEAADQLNGLLRESIGQQMIADVPLGAFLSGGIDSSTIVALMQAQSHQPVRTFSIGFTDESFNEARHAKEVAGHLRTDHTEFYVQPEELRNLIDQLPMIYDEPFADSSQIPTILLCQLTRQQVTVSLSGDGGDELFGGYDHYPKTEQLWSCFQVLPQALRELLARMLRSVLIQSVSRGGRPAWLRRIENRILNYANVLPATSAVSLSQLLAYPCRDAQDLVQEPSESLTCFENNLSVAAPASTLQQIMYLDAVSYLPDDLLVKVDRAAMSVSLETRIPFLDHRIVEFAWTLPRSLLLRKGQGKWLLRQVLKRYVPHALTDRPKKGFAVPLSDWLRGPLREWAESLLGEARIQSEGFFQAKVVRRVWQEHLAQQRDWGTLLWNVLMFQAWLETQSPVVAEDDVGMSSRPEAMAQID